MTDGKEYLIDSYGRTVLDRAEGRVATAEGAFGGTDFITPDGVIACDHGKYLWVGNPEALQPIIRQAVFNP